MMSKAVRVRASSRLPLFRRYDAWPGKILRSLNSKHSVLRCTLPSFFQLAMLK